MKLDKSIIELQMPVSYRIFGDAGQAKYYSTQTWRDNFRITPYVNNWQPINQWFGETAFDYTQFGMIGHNGIDFSAMNGACLYSMLDAKVIWVKSVDDGYGENIATVTNLGTIQLEAIYGHLQEQFVVEGQDVPKGKLIGLCDNCFDKETEILTDSGWKYFKDLNGSESVATLNIEKDELEFQKPTKYTKKYEEYMNLCEYGKVNFCVSDDHNMLIYHGVNRDKLKLIKYSDIPQGYSIKLKHNTNWIGKEEKYFVFPSTYKKQGFRKDKYFPEKKIDMDLWLDFLGILLADGYVDLKRNRISIAQSLSYPENIEKIQDLFDNMPFHYNVCDRKQFSKYNEMRTWSIVDKQLINVLQDIGTKANKKAPEYIKELSSRQIKIFLDSFFMGDGYERRNKEKYYYPGLSKILADQIQEYILKTCGHGSISEKVFNVSTNYQVYEHNSKNSYITKNDCERVLYNDYAYCVSVPNRTLYIRRNGRPLFLGNSGYPKVSTGAHLHAAIRPLFPLGSKNNLREHWKIKGWGWEDNGYQGYVDFRDALGVEQYKIEREINWVDERYWRKYNPVVETLSASKLKKYLKRIPNKQEIKAVAYGKWLPSDLDRTDLWLYNTYKQIEQNGTLYKR